MKDSNFDKIYWFIVGLCSFGAAFSVFLVIFLPPEAAQRIADTALIFWLSTAVAGGIGYLIGNSAKNTNKPKDAGATTAEISASITTNPDEQDNNN